VLTVFPTQKVKASGPWRTTFNDAIAAMPSSRSISRKRYPRDKGSTSYQPLAYSSKRWSRWRKE